MELLFACIFKHKFRFVALVFTQVMQDGCLPMAHHINTGEELLLDEQTTVHVAIQVLKIKKVFQEKTTRLILVV